MVITPDEMRKYIGQPATALPTDVNCMGHWPVVDPITMLIIDVMESEDAGRAEAYTLADIVGDRLLINDHTCDFLVPTPAGPKT